MEPGRLHNEEASDNAPEVEGDVLFPGKPRLLSRKTQTVNEDCDDEVGKFAMNIHIFFPASGFKIYRSKDKHERLFTHFIGFNSGQGFLETLNFLMPNLGVKNTVNLGTEEATRKPLDTERILSDKDDAQDNISLECRPREGRQAPSATTNFVS